MKAIERLRSLGMLRNVVWQMSFDIVEKTAVSLFRVKEDVNY